MFSTVSQRRVPERSVGRPEDAVSEDHSHILLHPNTRRPAWIVTLSIAVIILFLLFSVLIPSNEEPSLPKPIVSSLQISDDGGNVGNALRFSSSGNNYQISILADSEVSDGTGLCLEAWVYYYQKPTDDEWCILSWMEPFHSWRFSLTSDERISMTVYTQSTRKFRTFSRTRLKPRQWYHIAVNFYVIGGSRITIDGLMEVSLAEGILNESTNIELLKKSTPFVDEVLVGRCFSSPDNRGCFDGMIGEPKVKGRTVQARDIRKKLFDSTPISLVVRSLDNGLVVGDDSWMLEMIVSNAVPKKELRFQWSEKHATADRITKHAGFDPFESTNRKRLPLGVVFYFDDINELRWSFTLWTASHGLPCSNSNNNQLKQPAELVLYYLHDIDMDGIESDLERILEEFKQPVSCFEHVRLLSGHFSHDRATEFTKAENDCWILFSVFEKREIVDFYVHILLISPEVQPIRPMWLERAVAEVMFSKFDPFWIKGSLLHDRGVHDDPNLLKDEEPFEMSSDPAYFEYPVTLDTRYNFSLFSFYMVGDKSFNFLLKSVWNYYLPTEMEGHPGGCLDMTGNGAGFSHALFEYRQKDSHFVHAQRTQHFLKWNSYLLDFGVQKVKPWEVIRDFDETYMIRLQSQVMKDIWGMNSVEENAYKRILQQSKSQERAFLSAG